MDETVSLFSTVRLLQIRFLSANFLPAEGWRQLSRNIFTNGI
jgi:hypothetical protein